ncbi:MAG TPA: alpha/beta hydrolase [Micropepsaceae bacterium]|jgi:alpha-beta hydrolase superfamily lysophospholipase|nr:alpha/beta hydrolase [Micropepsaceae bacterium]
MHPESDQLTADNSPSRRKVLSGIGLAAAAAAMPSLAARAATASGAFGVQGFFNKEYTAKKGDVKLQLYRRRAKEPVAGAAPLPVLVMVHGSSIGALSSWDLTVPGAGEYNMMSVFSRFGYDVWAIDFEGYGKSDVTSGNSDIKSGVADLEAAVPLIAQETGQQKFHFMGESSGALRVAAFAAAHPERMDRALLGAYTYTGKDSPTLTERAKNVEFYRTHNRRPRPKEMIESIFTRDKPGTSDNRVAAAMVASELRFGDSVPTGTYLDMTAKLPIIEAKLVKCPVLLARGQYDGIATEADILDFYGQLPNPDRQLSILPGLAHSLTLGLNRQLYWHVANAFLGMPKAQLV